MPPPGAGASEVASVVPSSAARRSSRLRFIPQRNYEAKCKKPVLIKESGPRAALYLTNHQVAKKMIH